MENQNFIFPKLPQSYLEQINEFEKKREELFNSSEEKYRVLYDGIMAFKNGLYFSSVATMRIFIEKNLRDKLISLSLDKRLGQKVTKKEYDKEEKKREDGIIKGKKQGDRFQKICDGLYSYKKIIKIKKKECEGLKKLYEAYRNPIQHCIYRRLIGYIGKSSSMKSLIKNSIQCKGKINSKEYRYRSLPTIMLGLCYVTLNAIDDIITITERK